MGSAFTPGGAPAGVIPSVMEAIFERVARMRDVDFTVRVGFVEIHKVRSASLAGCRFQDACGAAAPGRGPEGCCAAGCCRLCSTGASAHPSPTTAQPLSCLPASRWAPQDDIRDLIVSDATPQTQVHIREVPGGSICLAGANEREVRPLSLSWFFKHVDATGNAGCASPSSCARAGRACSNAPTLPLPCISRCATRSRWRRSCSRALCCVRQRPRG